MGQELAAYLQRLEIMAFFIGYPLVYFIILTYAGKLETRTELKKRLITFLPLGYSITGLLFLGLQLRNLYPDYTFEHIRSEIQNPFLLLWGIMAIFFWLPFLRGKPFISLFHSLVFFYQLLKDLYLHITTPDVEKSILKNDMSVYANSLLLHIVVFSAISFFYFLIKWSSKRLNKNS